MKKQRAFNTFSNNLQLLKMNKLPTKQEEKRENQGDKHLFEFADLTVEMLDSIQNYLKAKAPEYSVMRPFSFTAG